MNKEATDAKEEKGSGMVKGSSHWVVNQDIQGSNPPTSYNNSKLPQKAPLYKLNIKYYFWLRPVTALKGNTK